MAKKKIAHKHKAKKKIASAKPAAERSPEYMIQISDPKMLRKDLLESLREVIIFMQGYEKFRKIQEEKVALFIDLKANVKDLSSLIDHKLRKYLPRGKLKPVTETKREVEKVEVVTMDKFKPKVNPSLPIDSEPEREMERAKPKNDLAELESQLNDIEVQLRNIR